MKQNPDTTLKVLNLRPRRDQAVKPAELIQITEHQALTLNARRSITILWHNAHLQGVAEGKDYTIEIDDLKPDNHHGYEQVEEAIEALMTSILKVRLPKVRMEWFGSEDEAKSALTTLEAAKRRRGYWLRPEQLPML
jgi:predicted DNA-binding WGR domain protein